MAFKRTCLFSAILAALLFLGMSSPAQAQFGVAAGLNFESTGDISTNTDATVDNSAGYHVGVVYDLSVGPLSLRPGVFYRKVGQTYKLPNSTADVAAWEVPVDLRLNVLPIPIVSPYILAGPKASFLRSDAGKLDDELKNISYSIAIGVGAEISLGSLITLQPELRYDIGTTDYIDDEFTVGNTTFSQKDPTLSAFALRLNLLF